MKQVSSWRRLLAVDQRTLAEVLREAIDAGFRNGLTRDEILDRMPERPSRRGFPKRDYESGGFHYPGIYRRFDPEEQRWVSKLGPMMTPHRLSQIIRADAKRKHPWFTELREDPDIRIRRVTLADHEHGTPKGVDPSRRPALPEPIARHRVLRICKHGHTVTEGNSWKSKNTGYWVCGPCTELRRRRAARARPKKRAYSKARRRRSALLREHEKRRKKMTTGNPSIGETPFGRAVVIHFMRGPWWRHPSLVARRFPTAKRHPSRPGRCARGHDLRRTAIVSDGLIACSSCPAVDK